MNNIKFIATLVTYVFIFATHLNSEPNPSCIKLAIEKFNSGCKGDFCTANMRDYIYSGKPADRLVMLVHQKPELIPETIEWISQTETISNSPRVALVSDVFPLQDSRLADSLTTAAFSGLGELPQNFNINTPEIHLLGGFCARCLSSATIDLLKSVEHNGHKNIELFVYADLVYQVPYQFREYINLFIAYNRQPQEKKRDFMIESMLYLVNRSRDDIQYKIDMSSIHWYLSGKNIVTLNFKKGDIVVKVNVLLS